MPKKFNAPSAQKTKVFVANFMSSGVKTKKKVFISKNARIFLISLLEPRKKKFFIAKSAKKKTVLAPEFWGNNQYFESLRPRTALEWYRACYFLWGTILVWGARSRNASPVAPGMVKSFFWSSLIDEKRLLAIPKCGEDLFVLNLTKESHVDKILSTNLHRKLSKPLYFLVRANPLFVVRAQPTPGTTRKYFGAVPT